MSIDTGEQIDPFDMRRGPVEGNDDRGARLFVYDNYPGGVGQSEPLWHRQHELVVRARELIERCDCKSGCPACVGPVLEVQEDVTTAPKGLALSVLAALGSAWA